MTQLMSKEQLEEIGKELQSVVAGYKDEKAALQAEENQLEEDLILALERKKTEDTLKKLL